AKILMNRAIPEQPDEEAYLKAASRELEGVDGVVHNDPDYRMLSARVRFNLGYFYHQRNQPGDAKDCYKAAHDHLEMLVRERPGYFEYRNMLSAVDQYRGFLHWRFGPREEAKECFGRGIEQRERLARDHPEIRDFQVDLANLYKNVGI